MSKELIEFINLLLIDGEITDKENDVIYNEAKRLGVSEEACEVILSSLLIAKPKKNAETSKKVGPKKVPVFQKLAKLNKQEQLEIEINNSIEEQRLLIQESESHLEDLQLNEIARNKVIEKSDEYQKSRETLKFEYLKILEDIQSTVESKLGSKAGSINHSDFLYKADESTLTKYYQDLTWDYTSLANKRRALMYTLKFLSWFLWFVLFYDWAFWEDGKGSFLNFFNIQSRWLGLDWYTILGGAIVFIYLESRYENKLKSNAMNFNRDDVANAVKQTLTSNIKAKISLLNSIDDELRNLKSNLKYQTKRNNTLKELKGLDNIWKSNKIN
jgi:hypothetical protein